MIEQLKQDLKKTFIDFFNRCQHPKNTLEEKENKIIIYAFIFAFILITVWLIILLS